MVLAAFAMYEHTQERKYRRIAKKATSDMTKWSKQQVPDIIPLMMLIDAEWKMALGRDVTVDVIFTVHRESDLSRAYLFNLFEYI